MPSGFGPWCAETCIGADECQAGNPHQGVASQKSALHRGIEWSNSTLALGLREWWGKTALGTAVDDNSGNDNCPPGQGCVTAPDPGQNPCIMVVGGVTDSTGDANLAGVDTMGGVGSYPLGPSFAGGIVSVGSQAFMGPNGSTSQFESDLASVNSQNIILLGFSGGAQTIATGVADLQSQLTDGGGCNAVCNVTGVIYVSPGAPGGPANLGLPSMTLSGSGPLNGLVGAVNINGTDGPVYPISGCDSHDFGCEVTGPNGVLNGVQSDCPGAGGNDATGGSPNVGELIGPEEDRQENRVVAETDSANSAQLPDYRLLAFLAESSSFDSVQFRQW